MELTTISQVSKTFGVSTRTLRYYEQIGLLHSSKIDDYAYRVYDADAMLRLQQIIILRKLRIPLKQISAIFGSPDASTIIDVFTQNLCEIQGEITALSTMRVILRRFIDELRNESNISLNAMLFSDEIMLDAINALSVTKINFKEEKSMQDLNQASASLSKLNNVRILHLPPCTVASSHFIGENPEENSQTALNEFIISSNLYRIKPDARVFGFNHPSPSPSRPGYGYETWVTLPDDMDVPAPLTKKQFPGGLYAAHTIAMGNFNEWEWLHNWVCDGNVKYAPNATNDDGECMNGLLEEHLNYVYRLNLDNPEGHESQLDLLFPIRFK